MKIRLLPLGVFAAVLVVGCGKQKTASNPDATASTSGTPAATATPVNPSPAPTATTAPAATPTATPAAKSGGGRTIEITSNDQMKFSLATMEAKSGEEITVKLTNMGTLPKEAMGHNWVLLQKGTDVNAFAQAAMTAKDTDYVPASMKDKVIASTPILGPKKSAEVTFKAPAPGEYTFICSFPGHYMLMKGTLTVK
jgi:azurin